jgi:hypothetical protein
MTPSTLLIDAGCAAYLVENYLARQSPSEDLDQLRSGVIQWIDRRLFLNTAEPLIPIWLMDSPPYWRSQWEPEYKSNRLPNGISPGKTLKAIRAEAKFSLAISGYEADDLAGAIVRSLPGMRHYLFTSDNDWAGLINDQVMMVSPLYSPHVRQAIHAWAWLEKHYRDLPKCRQLLYNMPQPLGFDPREIWRYKARLGDSGDNLPPCTHPGLIDLLQPLVDPLNDAQAMEKLWTCIMSALDHGTAFDYDMSQQFAMALPELPFNPIRIGQETIA